MKGLHIDGTELRLDFDRAKALADVAAAVLVDEPLLLAFYDRDRNLEAPGHVSECHEGCEVPGYIDYAANRGAELRIDIDGGRFVFCYRRLGEFSSRD
jgi:hypothetical protein